MKRYLFQLVRLINTSLVYLKRTQCRFEIGGPYRKKMYLTCYLNTEHTAEQEQISCKKCIYIPNHNNPMALYYLELGPLTATDNKSF